MGSRGVMLRWPIHLPDGDVMLEGGLVLFRNDQQTRILREQYAAMAHETLGCAAYHSAYKMLVLASIDVTPHGPLLHISLSYRDHNPSWTEIKRVRGAFFPSDRDAMLVLPRESDYINVHEHCFHVWETPEPWGIR